MSAKPAVVTIDAPVARVWAALVDANTMTRFMPVTDVQTDWTVGAPITWTTTLGKRTFEVRGTITHLEPTRVLGYRFTDPLARHDRQVTIALEDVGNATRVTAGETDHQTDRERIHAEGAWRLVLANLKAVLEGRVGS